MGKLLSFIIKASIYLTVFLVPLVWSPWTFESFEFPKQYVLIFLVLLGVLAWLIKMVLVEREIHFKRTPLDVPIFLFVLIAVLSSFFSADLWSSLFGYYGRFSDGLFGILAAVGLYVLIINNITRPSFLVRPFLLSSAVVVTIGYLSLFEVIQQFSLSIPFFGPIQISTIAESSGGLLIFLAFLVSFLALLSARPEIKQLPWARNLVLLFFAFGVLLIGDMSEAWIVLIFGLVLVLLSSLFQRNVSEEGIKLRRLWLPAVLLLLSVISFFSATFPGGFVGQVSKEPRLSYEASFNIASQSLKESGKNFLFGSGIGTFAIDFSLYKEANFNTTSQWQTRFDKAASHLVELLATTGILGLLSYLGIIVWFLFASLFFLKGKKNFLFVFGVLVLLLAQLLYHQIMVLQVAFWLFLALAVISWELPKKEFCFTLRKFFEFDLLAKLMLLIIFFGVFGAFFFGARFFAADMSYRASQNTLNSNFKVRIDKALHATTLNPWQVEYKIFLSALYLKRASEELKKPESLQDQEQISKDIQRAIAYARGDNSLNQEITGATELSPNKVTAWEALGALYRDIQFVEGALDQGIDSYATAIALEPTSAVLYTELGELYVINEEFKKARESFDRAIELKRDYSKPQLQLALLEEKEGDTIKALARLKDINLRYPLNVEGMFQLGRLLYNTGQVDEAILQFKQVLGLVPSYSNALFALGAALESQGRVNEAIEEFDKVLGLNPDNPALKERLQELQDRVE